MKKLIIGALVGILVTVLVLAGCANQNTSNNSSASPTDVKEQTETIVGGWTVYDSTTPAINDDIRASWDKAMEGYTGVGYEPIRVLATQVVSGSNYAILARGTTVTATPTTDWYVVVLYVDLEGNAKITSAERIDLSDIQVADESVPAGDIVGGWTVLNSENSALEPEDAQKALDKACETYEGVELHPIATLGTQVVAGANYRVLCTGAAAKDDSANELYVATVYVNPQGDAQITDVAAVNLLAYLG